MKNVESKVWLGGSKLEVIKPSKNKLCITIQKGHTIIDKEDISHLIADSNYTTIYYNEEKILCAQTLGSILKKINQPNFIRIHKSHAINIDYARMIDTPYSYIKLDDGTQLPISRSHKQELKNLIKRRFD